MKNKKIISIVISILLVISLTATVFIATANAKEVSITVTTDKQELKSGETATVSVSVTTNFPVATMSIPVFYDKTLVDVDSSATPLDYAYATSTTDKTAVDSDKIYANTGIESDDFGFVLATYIAGVGDTVDEMLTDTIVLTFTITAKADVNGSAVFKVIEESAKTEEKIKGMLYFGAQPEGNIIDEIPENVENIDVSSTTVNISNGKNTLLVKEDFEYADYVVIDTNNTNNGEYTGIVYGIDLFDQNMYMEAFAGSLADALTTNNGDDYLVIEANEMGMESTGATITVIDENGDALETYVFIYFGDIDGDGMISGNDSYIASEYEITYEGINSFAEYVAADLDGDGMPSGNDGYLMGEFEVSYSDIDYQYNMGQNAVNNYYEWIY